MKRASINFIASMLYQLTNLVIGLFLPKYYTEIFGSAYNGLNSSIMQVMSLLAVLQFGIAAPSIQQMFKYIATKDQESIAAIYWDTGKQYRRMGYIFLTAIVPIIILFPFALQGELPYAIIVSFILFRAVSAAMEYFFQAKYNVVMIAHNLSYMIYFINIGMLLFSTTLHVLVLVFSKDILMYQAVSVCATLVRLLVVSTYIKRKLPYLKEHKKKKIKVEKSQNRKDVLISEIAGLVIGSTDLLVLGSMSSLVSASIYSVYNYVTTGLGSILGSCREAVFAGVGKTYYEDFKQFQNKMGQFESVYLFLAIFLYATAILLFRPFIEVYTAKMDAVYYYAGFPILFILVKFVVNIRIPAIVAINTAGHFQQVRNYAVMEAIINLSLSLALVKPLGIYGVLIGTLVGGIYRTPLLIRYVNKNIIKRKQFKYWRKVLLWLPLLALCYLLSVVKPIPCTSLMHWIGISIPVAGVVLLVSLGWMFLFDKSTLYTLWGGIKKILRRKG